MAAVIRIAVITAGHPSTCPRMVKAADALSDAGHDVRLVCARFIDWATEADRDLLAGRRWRTTVVDYSRATAPLQSRRVGVRRRLARITAAANPGSWWATTRAFSYVHPELVRAALAEPADLFYGGTTGALAAVEEAARRSGRRFGLDLEDVHTSESTSPESSEQHGQAGRILSRVLLRAAVRTTASQAMADVYRQRFGAAADVIHNVFPLPVPAPVLSRREGPLRCYWFSQTIGPGRGLDEFVDAAAMVGVPLQLTVQGRPIASYVDALRARAAAAAPALALEVAPPVPPRGVMEAAARHDIGLCLEDARVENRDCSISNKFFTGLASGLALIATSTRGQRALSGSLGEAVTWCGSGDARSIADGLGRWDRDRGALLAARQASWHAASTRWHWGHPCESGRLVAIVESALA